MGFKAVRFSRKNNAEFTRTLKKRVNEYFKRNNISRKGNYKMVIKTICMLALFFVPYLLMLFSGIEDYYFHFIMWCLMGLGMAGIGFSVMHDGNHGSYSRYSWINSSFGNVLVFLVGSISLNWKIQHNVLHHTFTNIEGLDSDIDPGFIMRFSPHQKRYKIHRLQHLYAWFFYGLLTISWYVVKDFKSLYVYHKKGLTKTKNEPITTLWTKLIVAKIIYTGFALVLPMLIFPTPWWITLLFFLSMHFLCGVVLALVFQLAHVMPETEFPIPEKNGAIENSWFIHQLETTANFAQKSSVLSWFIGGLNFQIEHHLFPGICHIHYKKISKIVKETTKEFGLPYHEHKTFFKALARHSKILKDLGKYDLVPGLTH